MPAFTLRGVDAPVALAEVLDGLDARVDGHRHFEFFVFPHADSALTRTNDVVDEPPQPRSKLRAYVDDVLLANRAFQLACVIGRTFPRAIPSLNRLVTRLSGIEHARRSLRPHLRLAAPGALHRDGVRPAAPGGRRRGARDQGDGRALRDQLPDRGALRRARRRPAQPGHERETVYVAVHAFKGMAWEPYFRAVEAIADEHGGRPHWGKRHFQTAATLAPRYPGWERFAAVRARLDPDGVFSNAYTDGRRGRRPDRGARWLCAR